MVVKWKDSKAKKLLLADLKSKKIPLDANEMGPQQAYMQRPEFTEVEYECFRHNLNAIRNAIKKEKSRAVSETASLLHDLSIHPRKEHNHRGEPRWDGSEAQRLLRLDMDAKKHKTMTPSMLYNTRKEYTENYPLEVFRKHIHQEEQRRKYISYLKNKNAKNAAPES